uniref:Uncharacterized protein n=3 Tax=Cycas TaxID=3395 RepID=A6H5N1_CYCTA|nr:hypothetical protein CYtaCp090 [Cycas taitungensis]YP_001312283.1 hypothetical protein CYtaCp118 [Cycas taitungensis]YP_007474606.1 hypothetical_protein [Cycas revoluta]YP_007474686.1 hypothetical_protein [Cycas revoluta]YP_009308176.1 hypothetical protein [Cycas panzhihuaensis]YP_009308256.1 hypothetical protein [Cycas panzhihuaensis]AEX99156.1 hypothetical_protein [Cycas revoluta]AEX99235.1 hypothetical_protein [Cycas revoluta]AOS53125.1 hypothetical protein [Cycas panzhihuaensis]AOS5
MNKFKLERVLSNFRGMKDKNKSINRDLLFLLEYRDLICIFLVERTIFVTNPLIIKKNGKCSIRT